MKLKTIKSTNKVEKLHVYTIRLRSPALLGVTDALGLRGDGASSLVVFNKAKEVKIRATSTYWSRDPHG